MRGNEGFNLVEVTLAMLIVAVGLLSVFSLFPSGLDANAKAIADTHSAIFAEEVFNGIRAEAQRRAAAERDAALKEDTVDPKDAWDGLPDALLPVAAPAAWLKSDRLGTQTTQGRVFCNTYTNISFRGRGGAGQATEIVDHALRYRLDVAPRNEKVMAATLYVWPNEFGSADPADSTIFYSEFYKFDF
ncbi:MAG: hypothetical protein JXR37_35780 [Kiritimatiellae bacterium]|nr:hypothetical protein [Kiritimatiellia bacterium]